MATEATPLNPWVTRANALACAGLAVAIAWVLVCLLYLFLGAAANETPASIYGTQAGAPAATQQKRLDAGAIALWHLFGEEGIKPVVAASQEVNAPPTRLNLELQGVFVAPKEQDSTAMISESRKESQLYRIGSRVSGNATLAAVFPNRVLLNIGGKMEALYFPEANRSGSAGVMTRGTPPPGGGPLRSVSARTGRVTELRRPGMGAGPMIGGMPSVEQAQEIVKALQSEMGSNPDALLGQFGLTTNNGRGYRISDTANPALAAVGGRPGDIITSVNGRAVGDPQSDVALIQDVMESGCAKLTIERNGRQFNAEACPGQ